MKNQTKKILLAACLTSTFSLTSLAEVEPQQPSSAFSANVSIANNYVYRGKTQHLDAAGDNDEEETIQVGIDYDFDNGFKVGAWGSNVSLDSASYSASSELDVYADYSAEINDIGYKIGYIAYKYPNAKNANLEEIYLSASYDKYGLTYYKGQDEAADYVEATYNINVEDIDISASIGKNSDTDGDNGYKVYGIGLSKAYEGLDYSINFTKTSEDDDSIDNQNHTVFSISKSF